MPELSEFFGVCLKGGDFSALKVLDIDDGRVSHGRMPGINAPLLQKMRFYADVTTFPKFTADGTPATNLLSLELEWSYVPLEMLIDILAEFPLIENIVIIDHESEDHQTISPPRPVISLKNLKKMSIGLYDVEGMNAFLAQLIIPRSANLSLGVLHSSPAPPPSDPDPDVTGPFERFLSPWLASAERLMIFPDHKRDGLLFRLFPKTSSLTFDLVSNGPDSVIKDGIVRVGYLADDHTSTPLTSLSLPVIASYSTNLISLSIDSFELPSLPSLRRALSSWKLLTCLKVTIQEPEIEKVLSALENKPVSVRSPQDEGRNGVRDEIICPRLERLDCSGTIIDMARMKQFLSFRKDKGVKMREVIVTRGFTQVGHLTESSVVRLGVFGTWDRIDISEIFGLQDMVEGLIQVNPVDQPHYVKSRPRDGWR